MASDSLPSIDFSTLVVSLSQTALVHLGEAPHPEGDAPQRDLTLARQTIDLLGILQEKTKGNLDGAEERLLDQVLYDLRLRYVELSSPKDAKGATAAHSKGDKAKGDQG
ncbi:MAG: hypothetical protein NVS3B10_22370 [Polyangiales bacterium]